MAQQTILFAILDQYADWEAAYVGSLLLALGREQYTVKTISLTTAPVHSLGGFTTIPDYDLQSTPDFAALILIGGMSWRTAAATQIKTLVDTAIQQHKILGAICDASAFLGTLGLLNHVRHTSNDLANLQQWAGVNYTGTAHYLKRPAVRDHNIITANGTAPLEFTKEILLALQVAPKNTIIEWYRFYKLGYYRAPLPQLSNKPPADSSAPQKSV